MGQETERARGKHGQVFILVSTGKASPGRASRLRTGSFGLISTDLRNKYSR